MVKTEREIKDVDSSFIEARKALFGAQISGCVLTS